MGNKGHGVPVEGGLEFFGSSPTPNFLVFDNCAH
jgi:hypothetical protein